MALHLPSEIIVERFLPTTRAMLASELNRRGLIQQQIADQLGVTQAAVSKYISGDAAIKPRFRYDSRMQETIERIAEGFVSETMDEYEALGKLLLLIREFEDHGPICETHEEEMPALQGLSCDLCVCGFDTDVLEERNMLASVRKAARMLADTPNIAEYIPNVGTNIGMVLPDATDERDVAAIHGQIHVMRERVNIPSNPKFGASYHVAQTILSAMNVDSTQRENSFGRQYASLGQRASPTVLVTAILMVHLIANILGVPISYNRIIINNIADCGFAGAGNGVDTHKYAGTLLSWLATLVGST